MHYSGLAIAGHYIVAQSAQNQDQGARTVYSLRVESGGMNITFGSGRQVCLCLETSCRNCTLMLFELTGCPAPSVQREFSLSDIDVFNEVLPTSISVSTLLL